MIFYELMTTFNGWNMRYWIVWHATATSVCISSEKTQWARVSHSKHFMRRWFRPLSLHTYIYIIIHILLLYIQYTYYIILSHYYTVIMKSACIYPKTFGHPQHLPIPVWNGLIHIFLERDILCQTYPCG